MGNLLHDLRQLDPDSYEGYDRVILKYALSLAEIVANDRRTRMTREEALQLPGVLEYVDQFILPKRWSFYEERNERARALLRERIAGRVREFVRSRGVGSVSMEGDAILVQGESDSELLVVLVDGGHERVKEYLARGAQVWSLWFFHENACVYRRGREQIVPPEGALEDPAILPGFTLRLSEVFREVEEE